MHFDGEAFGQQMVSIVREYLGGELEPLWAENKALLERIAALEAREIVLPENGAPGRDGKDADMDEVVRQIEAKVAATVSSAVASIPVPKDGAPGEPGCDGKDGLDADPAELRAFALTTIAESVPAAVKAAVDALPPPEKGDRGESGVPGEPGPQGEPGHDGKDGIGLAGMMIDRSDELVATLSDGTLTKLGRVVGRDGKDGEPGPAGKDGRNGHDLEDFTVTQDGTVVEVAATVGETRTIYEFELPPGPAGEDGKDAYPGEAKGLFDPSATYRALDVVSHNGSEWRAKQDNPGELPGPGWMLSACKGKRGDKGDPGQVGKDGVSSVAQYLRGSELVTTLSDGAEFKTDLSPLRDLEGEVH